MARAMKSPTTRPVLPRINSAASGLRFCGMIDEPVVKASDRCFTKPNAGVVHCTSSPASRDRWVEQIVAAAMYSSAKSRALTASSELRIEEIEAEFLCRRLAVDRKRCAGQRRSAKRGFVQPFRGVAKPSAVARQHLDIGEAMMPEGNRLRGLHMGEARHDGIGVLGRLCHQRTL